MRQHAASTVLLFLLTSAANAQAGQTEQQRLPEIQASEPRGFHSRPFELGLMAAEGARIRFTVDGSQPGLANGLDYRSPIAISNTTVLRTVAFADRNPASSISTFTYIFPEQILHQSEKPAGFPAGPSAWNGEPSAYGMNPGVVNEPIYQGRMLEALKSLPTVSLVLRREDLFSSRTGIYLNSMQRGPTWERPGSVEFITPDGSPGFQIDCGVRIQGNYNRRPEKSPKHSFRLLFKAKYGATKLHYSVFPDSPVKKFDTLVLRADYNNSWIHWDASGRARAQRTRDAWMKDTHRAMGWVAGHNRYAHLFLNGLYWGIYDLAERPDASFASSHWGGDKTNYDVVNEFQVKDGTGAAFNALHSIRNLDRKSQYEKLKAQLDLNEYIDYLLLNYYAGNHDWGENKNWYAIRRRNPPGPFQFFVWDGEQVLEQLNDDIVNSPFEVPFHLAEELRDSSEFRIAFADRAHKHLLNEGVLTPASVAALWMKRATELDQAIIAESARWGSYRRETPYTRDREWLTEQRRLLRSYFPNRTRVVLGQLRSAGLYPQIPAPVISQPGGLMESNLTLTLNVPDRAMVYFTTNGSDPRVVGTGAVAPEAMTYEKPITLAKPVKIEARTLKEKQWSALAEAVFTNSATR